MARPIQDSSGVRWMFSQRRRPALRGGMGSVDQTSVRTDAGQASTCRQGNQDHRLCHCDLSPISLIEIRSRYRGNSCDLSAGFNEAAVFVLASVQNTVTAIGSIEPVVSCPSKENRIATSLVKPINDRPFFQVIKQR